jgi:hypothetical protein
MRTPIFELHIRPMFRLIDRDHMAFRLDLFDYDQLRLHADRILQRLKTDMPTNDTGGPWPEEWVALFERWCTSGYRRLELGRASYSITVSGTRATLRAVGAAPAGYKAWLEIVGETVERRSYVLQFEPPDTPAPGEPGEFSLRDRFDAADARPVWIRDADGEHAVPRP